MTKAIWQFTWIEKGCLLNTGYKLPYTQDELADCSMFGGGLAGWASLYPKHTHSPPPTPTTTTHSPLTKQK